MKPIKLNLVLISSILIIANLNGIASATDYYINPTGNDNNPGTFTQPWQTFGNIAGNISNGSTFYIMAGVYNQRIVISNYSNITTDVRITNYSTDNVTIDGTGLTMYTNANYAFGGLIEIQNSSHINITNLRVINSQSNGILVSNSSYVNLTRNYIINTTSSCIIYHNSTNFNVTYNDGYICDNTSVLVQEDFSIDGFVSHGGTGTRDFEVAYNKIHDSPQTDSSIGIDLKNGVSNGYVHDNEIYNTHGHGIYVDAWTAWASNISIYNNKIHNVLNGVFQTSGIKISVEQNGTTNYTRVFNNLVYDNDGTGILVGDGFGIVNNISVIGNTVVHNGYVLNKAGISQDNTTNTNITIRNNIVYNNSLGQIITVNANTTVDHNLVFPFRNAANELRGSWYIEQNPLLASNSDFHLNLTSPAIYRGSLIDVYPFDYDRLVRPQGLYADIGAYEYPNPPALIISYVSPTENNNTIINTDYTTINTAITGAGVTTAFINFNRSLIAWYRFNLEQGENDTNLVDWSGNRNNGTLLSMTNGLNNGSSGWNSNGYFNNTINFNGINNSILVLNSNVLNQSVLTIEFRFKTPQTLQQGGINSMRPFASRYDSGNNQRVWKIGLMNPFSGTNDQNRFGVGLGFPNNGTLAGLFYINETIQTNTWYYGAFVFNNGVVKLRLNTSNESILSNSGGVVPPSLGNFNINMSLGVDYNAGVPNAGDYFSGKLDEFRIWGRELSSTELNASYDALTYPLQNSFTSLANNTSYNYTAYLQDGTGLVVQTSLRTINIDYSFGRQITATTASVDCAPIKSSLNAGFILVGIILIVVATALIVMGLRSQNMMIMIPGIGAIVIGSALIYIGFFVNATLSTAICIPPP